MYKKVCPHCGGDSYSAASRGYWECPYCRADLTACPAEPASKVSGTGNRDGLSGLSGQTDDVSLREKTGAGWPKKLVPFRSREKAAVARVRRNSKHLP